MLVLIKLARDTVFLLGIRIQKGRLLPLFTMIQRFFYFLLGSASLVWEGWKGLHLRLDKAHRVGLEHFWRQLIIRIKLAVGLIFLGCMRVDIFGVADICVRVELEVGIYLLNRGDC